MSTSAHRRPTTWVRTWSAAPQVPEPFLDLPETFEDVTVGQTVRVSGGGCRVRVRFSNEFSGTALTVSAARIGLVDDRGQVLPAHDRAITFSGRPLAVVPAGAPLLSDPVDLPLPALSRVSVRLHLPLPTQGYTGHVLGPVSSWTSPGDHTRAASAPPGAGDLPAQVILSAVEVEPEGPADVVVALGDSITDGVGSTPDAARRWTDQLAARLAGRAGNTWSVANQGISGNRLLNGGVGGTSGLARFDRDVLATPGLGAVIVFVGGNDIGVSYAPTGGGADFLAALGGTDVTADDVVAAYRQLVERAHDRGVPVYGATLTPYGGTDHHTAEGEQARQRVNDWIRTSRTFDHVLDFDAVWRDPDRGDRIRDGLHAGDHLHGSDAGYRALAESVDLALFPPATTSPPAARPGTPLATSGGRP